MEDKETISDEGTERTMRKLQSSSTPKLDREANMRVGVKMRTMRNKKNCLHPQLFKKRASL